MKTVLMIIFLLFFKAYSVLAQHEHHQPASKEPAKKTQNTKKKKTRVAQKNTTMDSSRHQMMQGGDQKDHMEQMMKMPTHSFSRNLPMNRNSSGTAWNPDASPMYMWMMQGKKTDWMFHGNGFLRYTHTDIFRSGSRGDDQIGFPNWFMAMMNRKVGEKGLFNATAMISVDRLTEGGNGYPLLFQSGETWKGSRLVDRQHPHDLFSSLSIGYTHMINKNMDVFAYFGYPGEPALGAPAFMHRVSSMNNPDAPLGHHWQDATHITFGVATIGFRYRQFKIEGSSFTGREPDEKRFGFDEPRFDSYSFRLSYNPTTNWALQLSRGYLNEPEALEPGVDVTRTTASILYSKNYNNKKHYSTALIWGLNDQSDDHREHSVLAENNFQFGKNAIFSRYEFIQKSNEELNIEDGGHHSIFDFHAASLGYNRLLMTKHNIDLTAGTKVTFNFPDKDIRNLYGDLPLGFQVYFQIRPSLHSHKTH